MRLFVLIFLLLSVSTTSQAGSCGASCACTAGGASLSMANYDPVGGSSITAVGTITVSCQLLVALGSVSVPFQVSLSKGNSPTYAPRTLVGPNAATMAYNLYSDAGMTVVWGDGTGGTGTVSQSAGLSVVGLSIGVPSTVYARIPGAQNVPVGSYGDTIVMTLQF